MKLVGGASLAPEGERYASHTGYWSQIFRRTYFLYRLPLKMNATGYSKMFALVYTTVPEYRNLRITAASTSDLICRCNCPMKDSSWSINSCLNRMCETHTVQAAAFRGCETAWWRSVRDSTLPSCSQQGQNIWLQLSCSGMSLSSAGNILIVIWSLDHLMK
jgi:hypothetical protein